MSIIFLSTPYVSQPRPLRQERRQVRHSRRIHDIRAAPRIPGRVVRHPPVVAHLAAALAAAVPASSVHETGKRAHETRTMETGRLGAMEVWVFVVSSRCNQGV